MFTGLVEETGTLLTLEERGEAWRMTLSAERVREGLAVGDSVACNGCCLTVVGLEEGALHFDLLEETLRLTSFASCPPGGLINLERSLAVGARLGGHFVSGHVDALAEVVEFEERGKNWYLRLRIAEPFGKYLVYKGSIALDGISLTVAEVFADGLAVWLIPHTLEMTNLRQRHPGDKLNVEFDLLAKYVERLLPTCQSR